MRTPHHKPRRLLRRHEFGNELGEEEGPDGWVVRGGLGGTDQFRATFTETTHTMSLPEELHCDSDNHDSEVDANNNNNRIQTIKVRDKIYESLMAGTDV